MTPPGLFVTGTDTDVGKTVVSTILALGLEAHYWKPIQTGPEGAAGTYTDSEFVARWIGTERVLPELIHCRLPASPHYAAAREGKRIDLDAIDDRSWRKTAPIIVEGAGGALVPLNESASMVDLMQRIALPIVIVTKVRLGCLNHSFLTAEALQRRSLSVLGFILTGEECQMTRETIASRTDLPILGHIPHLTEFSANAFRAAFTGLQTELLTALTFVRYQRENS